MKRHFSEQARKNISMALKNSYILGKRIPPMKNKHHSKEAILKMSINRKGIPAWNKGLTKDTDERVKKYANSIKVFFTKHPEKHPKFGTHWSEKNKRKISLGNIGKHNFHHTEETKKRISLAHTGEKSYLWKGGISKEPYGLEFNNLLKKQIRARDKFRCQECFRHESELNRKLYIHHIDYNKKNNNPNNLISLCLSCHAQTGFGRDDWKSYFENRLLGVE